MPHVARFKIAAIEELFRQLHYAPPETKRKLMDGAEMLIADVDPAHTYPEDFVVFRITGYRPQGTDEPAMLVGEALIADLVNLVQRFSWMLELRAEESGRRVLTLEEVGRRLNVSPKSVQRYRRTGLVCHYVVFGGGEKRLACFEDALERFVEHHRGRVEKAGAFTRVGPPLERRIIQAARRLHDEQQLSLTETARRLAQTHGRAHETVRMLLLRHDRRSGAPIFAQRAPLSPRDLRLVDRAWCFGVTATELARRFNRTPAAMQRVINRERLAYLQRLDLHCVELPTFALDDASAVILASPAVRREPASQAPDDDALALIEWARRSTDHDEGAEDALVAGYNFLKRRVREAIDDAPQWPSSAMLDRIETDLRWAAGLKERLVDSGWPVVVARIEQNLHGPLPEQPGEQIRRLLRLGARVLSEVIETLDPSRRQKLRPRAALALDRQLPGADIARGAGRAAARHAPGSVRLRSLCADLTPWQRRLGMRSDLRRLVGRLEERLAIAASLRYGLSGEAPLSFPELAERLGTTPSGAARLVKSAQRELRRMARPGS